MKEDNEALAQTFSFCNPYSAILIFPGIDILIPAIATLTDGYRGRRHCSHCDWPRPEDSPGHESRRHKPCCRSTVSPEKCVS